MKRADEGRDDKAARKEVKTGDILPVFRLSSGSDSSTSMRAGLIKGERAGIMTVV